DGAPGDGLYRRAMQRLGVHLEVALGFDKAAGLEPRVLALQEARQQRAEGLAGADPGELLLSRRILPEPDLRQQGLGDCARPARSKRTGQTKYNAARSSGDGILDHP